MYKIPDENVVTSCFILFHLVFIVGLFSTSYLQMLFHVFHLFHTRVKQSNCEDMGTSSH